MFMGSFTSSNHDHHHNHPDDHHHQEENTVLSVSDPQHPYHPFSQSGLTLRPPNSTDTRRQLLFRCVELISRSDFSSAQHLVFVLTSNSSPYGDSTERLVYRFARALALRLGCYYSQDAAATTSVTFTATTSITGSITAAPVPKAGSVEAIRSSYLSLNQITPFIRFSHLTANQAILDALVDKALPPHHQQAIHILDFDIMHGLQWPPFMQALVERSGYNNNTTVTTTPAAATTSISTDPDHDHMMILPTPPMLRITAFGTDSDFLQETGDRLCKFAQSLGLIFQFQPLIIANDKDLHNFINPSSLHLLPNEALAVNSVLYLHRLLEDDRRLLLHRIKTLNPMVITLTEREANHNHPFFFQRFIEAVDHYSAIFDSLEATLPPNSPERLAVEQVWFGREVKDIIAGEGGERRQRHERYESWELMLRSAGFSNIPLSPFALSQAKLLLRLHYPSVGYQLRINDDHAFFLGWQNRSLFSVSSWK